MSYTFYTPEMVLSEIHPITSLISEALDIGTQEAREYFKKCGEEIEPYLASNLARYHAKKFLQDHGQDVEDYKIQKIALNGLFLKYQKFHIRILKSQAGELPPPGQSKARQQYYRQEFLQYPDEEEGHPEEINLIVIWGTNINYEVLKDLKLSYPKDGGTGKSSVEDYWTVPIPDPIKTIKNALDSSENSTYKDLEFVKIDKNKKQNKK